LPLRDFKATDFRCLADAELELDPQFNLIYGDNASGKTSVLEAIAYLGRGKSFRGAPTASLIRHGAGEFLLFGNVEKDGRVFGVGARNGAVGLETSIAGEHGGGAAALATALPLQVIDPEVHRLVSGGPDERRRYLDWLVFHVEQGYVSVWRRFRRALKQRNAALRAGTTAGALYSWDQELSGLGEELHETRRRVFDFAVDNLREVAGDLLRCDVNFEYRRGWPEDLSLLESLAAGRGRDAMLGSTQAGPHRGDIRLIYEDRQARRLVSRGQQKLLSCAMILAATDVAQDELGQQVLLLLDDPAAELDSGSLERLMTRVIGLGSQVIATSLEQQPNLFPQQPTVFHVEQGVLKKTA
jgi:DNA replication and repair protein RecF